MTPVQPQQDSRSSILEALEKNLPAVLEENQLDIRKEEKVAVAVPADSKLEKEAQDDYEFSRQSYRDLVQQSNQALEAMLNLALQSEHPRAFEVLSGMLKNTSEITDKLMDLQKKKKEMQAPAGGVPPAGGNTSTGGGNNNFFFGSTADLQKRLIRDLQEKNVTDSSTVNDPS